MTDKTEIQSTEQITQDPEELTLAALKKIQELEAEKERKRLKHNEYMRNYYRTKKGKAAMQKAQKNWYKPHGKRGRPKKDISNNNVDGE